MNTKWYIGFLVLVLAFIGLNNEQTKVANQQIVLQFSDSGETAVTEHDDVLALVTKKLQLLGIAEIEVIEQDHEQLRIRYYSDIDANSIGDLLSEEGELTLFYADIDPLSDDFPKEKLPENCSIIVSDLQQTDYASGLNGKLALELKPELKRFSNPGVVRFDDAIALGQELVVKVAYRANWVVAIAIDNTSHTIPEVRAGPKGVARA